MRQFAKKILSASVFIAIATVLCAALSLTNDDMRVAVGTRRFTAIAADGTALSGQIDFATPLSRLRCWGCVAFLIGGTNSERSGAVLLDGRMRYLMDELAYELNAKGIAVVRFDQRGILNYRDCVGSEAFSRSRSYVSCFDPDVRRTIGAGTLQSDAYVVLNHARHRFAIEEHRLALVGFSEGGLIVADLISEALLAPQVAVLASTPLEPFRSAVRWQFVDKLPEVIEFSGASFSNEMAKLYFANRTRNAVQRDFDAPVLSADGSWRPDNVDELRDKLKQIFEKRYVQILSASGSELWFSEDGELDVPSHSVAAAQEKLRRSTPLTAQFLGYKGKLRFVLGSEDEQFPLRRQLPYIHTLNEVRENEAGLTTICGANHTLLLVNPSDGQDPSQWHVLTEVVADAFTKQDLPKVTPKAYVRPPPCNGAGYGLYE
ncbi:MAG: hypothetical protein ACK5TK_07640 [Betaproteobacteria bacterium]